MAIKKFTFIFAAIMALTLKTWAGAPDDLNKLVKANNEFAFDLLSQVAKTEPNGNVFISPFSVSSVLQMVGNGAAGKTKEEMLHALRTSGLPTDSLNAAFKNLNNQLSGRSGVTLNLADGIWYLEGYRVKPAFLEDNQKYFRAELAGVNFENPESARKINDWAERKTEGKIKDVVSYPFPPLTRLILANAIYFKGTWTTPFEKRATIPWDFHLGNGQTKSVPMMTRHDHFSYKETLNYQAVKLPYNGDLEMEVYLPKTNSTPLKVADMVAGDRGGFSSREGSLMLPKFKMEYEKELNQPLIALGMTRAFKAGAANFSGIADEPLFISEVKQKSFVDVNEQGTEAAAVTAVTVTAAAIRMPPPNVFTMIVDRPFFFVISDVKTGSILFVGIVNDPRST